MEFTSTDPVTMYQQQRMKNAFYYLKDYKNNKQNSILV